jgi:hypothetical protein
MQQDQALSSAGLIRRTVMLADTTLAAGMG